jgi:RimJ/RimL family protein N-acetyltransferase
MNVGYYLFPATRESGYASRAVELLLLHLARETEHEVATLLIHRENAGSLRLAQRLGFEPKARSRETLFRASRSGNGAYRDRTGDLRLAKPALSQLS